MDLLFQLPFIQTKDVDSRLRVEPTRGAKYVALWQEDHLKINDGKVKERLRCRA
jgi:hypothetical protein